MNCIVCNDEITTKNRGGSYCGRCAGMHARMSWDKIKVKRMSEQKEKREQLNIS